MHVAGRIENGMVVFPAGTSLPEGVEVLVSLNEPGLGSNSPTEIRARCQGALARIDNVPNENLGDSFSGEDHDQVLYGDAE